METGDLVKIREEWKDGPKDTVTYKILAGPNFNNRFDIVPLDSGLSIVPIESVFAEMIEPA